MTSSCEPVRRVVIVGAGAMGCLFASRLAEAGADVTVVDVDRKRLSALAKYGILLSDDRGSRTVPIRAISADELDCAADLVMVFTKGIHTEAASASASAAVGRSTIVLTLQNGLGNGDVIGQAFGRSRVLVGTTDLPADLSNVREIHSHGAGHIFLGGLEPGQVADDAARRTAALFDGAGLATSIDEEIQTRIWSKVAFNAVLNSVAAVTGLSVGQLHHERGLELADAVVNEIAGVASAIGVRIDPVGTMDRIRFALAHHGDHKPSMLQDRLAGRQSEIETINGAIVRTARSVGIDVPITATLANLMRLIDANRPLAGRAWNRKPLVRGAAWRI